MQTFFMKTTIAALSAVAFCFGSAFCGENIMPIRDRSGFMPPPPPPPPGVHLLVKYQMDNLLIKTMAELSGKAVETIENDFGENPPPYLLEKYGIDLADFDSALSVKMIELVKNAQTNGQITQAQAMRIIEEINTHPTP